MNSLALYSLETETAHFGNEGKHTACLVYGLGSGSTLV